MKRLERSLVEERRSQKRQAIRASRRRNPEFLIADILLESTERKFRATLGRIRSIKRGRNCQFQVIAGSEKLRVYDRQRGEQEPLILTDKLRMLADAVGSNFVIVYRRNLDLATAAGAIRLRHMPG